MEVAFVEALGAERYIEIYLRYADELPDLVFQRVVRRHLLPEITPPNSNRVPDGTGKVVNAAFDQGVGGVDFVAPQRPHRRSPERHRRPEPESLKRTARPATSPSAASTRCAGPSRSSRHRAAIALIRRAKFFGSRAPRDKDRARSSRKVGRESTT